MQHRRLVLVAALPLILAAPASAHFLFVRVTPPAEGGRAAEVYFSDLAEAGDPRFLDKISSTKLWIQTRPGEFEMLKLHRAADRLRAWVPSVGSLMVVGECRYGVLTPSGKTPFLLRHHPKAIAGTPDEVNKLRPYGKLPLEIAATIDGDSVHLTALRDGKPLPKAEFVVIDAGLKEQKLAADADGKAVWKPAAMGNYSIYTRHTTKEAGEANGQKYEEIRDFATVALTWPLERKDADAEAVTRFEEALAKRASWKEFPGFRARITGNLDGRTFTGEIQVDAQGKVSFTDDDSNRAEAVAAWVEEQFESIVLHRLARPASAESSHPVLRFGESKEDHPLGRLLIFDGGRFASSYRVKDKQVLVVNRCLGKENMTITVLENDRNEDGLYLPRNYTVQIWNAANGELKRSETVNDRWKRVGAWDLPEQRTVTTAAANGVSVRTFTLTKQELRKNK
jgi:hypothetical protein